MIAPRLKNPKPKPLARIPVTICAGILCSDGIVLSADTQESYGSEKSYVSKLFPCNMPHARLIVAGSGIGPLIDYAKDKIFEFSASNPEITKQEFKSCLGDLMNELYENEFRRYPLDQNKATDLLVAVQLRNEAPFMLVVDSTLVSEATSRVIGIGLMTPIAAQFQGMGLTCGQAMWACMYMVREAKLRYEGVGGNTQIIGIRNNEIVTERNWDMPQREQFLGRMEPIMRLLFIAMVPASSDHLLDAILETTEELVRHSRKELTGIDQQYLRTQKEFDEFSSKASKRLTQPPAKPKPSASRKSKDRQ
jgi:hypothetical protein